MSNKSVVGFVSSVTLLGAVLWMLLDACPLLQLGTPTLEDILNRNHVKFYKPTTNESGVPVCDSLANGYQVIDNSTGALELCITKDISH